MPDSSLSRSGVSEAAVLLALDARYPYAAGASAIAAFLDCDGRAVVGKLRRLANVGLAEQQSGGRYWATSAAHHAIGLLR